MKYFSLLTLLLCISCNPEPVKVLDLTNYCNQETLIAKSVAAEGNCDDPSQYKCDVREFSPSMVTETKKNVEYCPEDSTECLTYDHHIFDTSDQKQVDEYASAADFEKGGQYNRQEVRCWNEFKTSRNPASESSSIKDALKAAYEICKQ